MKNHISVFITKEDFETKDYMSNLDCPLATALKRQGYVFGYDVGCHIGGTGATLNDEQYGIVEWEELANTSDNPQNLMVNLLRI